MKIWLDDERKPPKGWLWAHDLNELSDIVAAVMHLHYSLDKLGIDVEDKYFIDVMSFDHDLGCFESGVPKPDGYDCIKFMTCWPMNKVYPREVQVHSMNPVGADNIRSYDKSYRRSMTA